MAAAVTWDLSDEADDSYRTFVADFRRACQSTDTEEGVPLLPAEPQVGGPELISVYYIFSHDRKQMQFVYTRHNVYLVGYQDGLSQWWGFLIRSNILPGAKLLSYSANYMEMGDLEVGFTVGRLSIINALERLYKGELPEQERKRHLKLLIVCGPESDRLDPVFTIVETAFATWMEGMLGLMHIHMIKNWSDMCNCLRRKEELSEGHHLRVAELNSYRDIAAVLKLCLRKCR